MSWQDYWAFSHEYDARSHTLTLRSKMIELPTELTRRLYFLEEG